jgi:hypothetical protein
MAWARRGWAGGGLWQVSVTRKAAETKKLKLWVK